MPIRPPGNRASRSMSDGYACCQHARAERVNGRLRDEFRFVLPDDQAQARLFISQAVRLYKEAYPYLALSYLPPNRGHWQRKSPAGKSERGPCLVPVNL